ncbi:MAG TPA: hypothetical protein P5277_03420 [Candidatus Paceibacterota bacterium]|nr:hypothetical protein [Candidatus Paceibacterota bacterium]
MIKEMKPLSLAESKMMIESNEENEKINEYLKRFSKIKQKDMEKLKEEILSLDNHKIKQDHITKIIDFLPEDASDINKIFTDISLEDNEIKQIIEIVAKYK